MTIGAVAVAIAATAAADMDMALGDRMQPMIDSNVVFPEPDGPMRSVSSPACNDRSTPAISSSRLTRKPIARSMTLPSAYVTPNA